MTTNQNSEKTQKDVFRKMLLPPTLIFIARQNKKKDARRLDTKGLRRLTQTLKEAKKKRFSDANRIVLDIAKGPVQTPVYLLDEALIEENMRILRYVKDRTECKILHALKAYASFVTFPMMATYLDGVCASGLHEARLGHEEFGKEVHTFSAAYSDKDIKQILMYSDSIILILSISSKNTAIWHAEKASEQV